MGCRWKRCVQLPILAGKTLSLRTFTAPSSPAAILEATHCRQWGQGWKELGLPLHCHCERSAFIMWSHWDVRVYLCHQLASHWLIYCFLIWEKQRLEARMISEVLRNFTASGSMAPWKGRAISSSIALSMIRRTLWASLQPVLGSSHQRPVVNSLSFLVPNDLGKDCFLLSVNCVC